MSIYTVLNNDAKSWWHHRDLRKQGNVAEARNKERSHIRGKIQTARGAILMTIGRHGFQVHEAPKRNQEGQVTQTGSVSGYGGGDAYRAILEACRPEVPIVDKRTVPDPLTVALVISGPLPAICPERADAPVDGMWSGFSYCPIDVFLAINEGLGATVHWGEYAHRSAEAYIVARRTIQKIERL